MPKKTSQQSVDVCYWETQQYFSSKHAVIADPQTVNEVDDRADFVFALLVLPAPGPAHVVGSRECTSCLRLRDWSSWTNILTTNRRPDGSAFILRETQSMFYNGSDSAQSLTWSFIFPPPNNNLLPLVANVLHRWPILAV